MAREHEASEYELYDSFAFVFGGKEMPTEIVAANEGAAMVESGGERGGERGGVDGASASAEERAAAAAAAAGGGRKIVTMATARRRLLDWADVGSCCLFADGSQFFGCDIEGSLGSSNGGSEEEEGLEGVEGLLGADAIVGGSGDSDPPAALLRFLYGDPGPSLHDDLAESFGLDFVACHAHLRYQHDPGAQQFFQGVSDAARNLHRRYISEALAAQRGGGERR